MNRYSRNPFIWFRAWLKKLMGVRSPTFICLYGRQFEFDFLKDYRRGIIQEEQRRFNEEMKKAVGG